MNLSSSVAQFSNILEDCFLPEVTSYSDLLDSKDVFRDHILKTECTLSSALQLLNSDHFVDSLLPRNVVIYSILLCGEHSEICEWTSLQCVSCANQLMSIIVTKSECSNLLELLVKYKIESFLSKLRSKTKKSAWKNHPAAMLCFKWVLSNIQCPYMGELLDSVLPPTLLLIDDHNSRNKVMGLQCLFHITNNVTYAELNQYGRGTVMYQAIEHMVYSREPVIIQHLGPCLIAVLKKTEQKSTTALKWSHFDDVLSIWLPSMEMEQNLVLREAYIESLPNFIEAMGLSISRWSEKLLSVLSEYTQQPHTQEKSLMTLQAFIKAAWPRLSSQFNSIAIILFKVVMKSSQKDSTLVINSLLVKTCMDSLEKLFEKEFNVFLSSLKSNSELSLLYNSIKRAKKHEKS